MLLDVHNLNTYYGMSHVLQGISLNVDRGEIIALLGRNGMGKSTTLKSIMGLVKPKTGSVTLNPPSPPCLVPDRIWQGRARTEIAGRKFLKETFGDFCHPDGV